MARSGSSSADRLVERFRAARQDPGSALLEGFHPLKHALRFGAEIVEAVTADADRVGDLARKLAPELMPTLEALLERIPPETFARLVPTPPPTAVVAIARRPRIALSDVLEAPGKAPVILLDSPARLGNLGAVVRVAAAAEAAGVIAAGPHDPWHPEALRGGVGLQFALPVARIDARSAVLGEPSRPLVAVDPSGELLRPDRIPPRAILAFGSERRGLGRELLDVADVRLAIPMRKGVSSLNLATSVAVVLYARWPYDDAMV